MSIVFILEGALDFEREVIVHLEHHVEELIVLLFAAPCVADESPQDYVDFAEIEAALSCEVRVDDGGSEAETTEAPGPLGSAEELELLLV